MPSWQLLAEEVQEEAGATSEPTQLHLKDSDALSLE
jgi:hypothetical protein